jgi:ectoine hydroxylase-related dioxygenase (phytanoyl-CoA dioxygenase family)
MPFRYTEQHREEYYRDGLTVLRNIIPSTLIADLRREADRARRIARQKQGPQAQRLSPIDEYPEVNSRPFEEFMALPDLQATVRNILGPGYRYGPNMAVLIEPKQKPWCTAWHRDWKYLIKELTPDVYHAAITNLHMFNQFNAALYEDHSFWVVPGSHNREDTPEEIAAFPEMPHLPPEFGQPMGSVEKEHACLEYCRRMPGAVQIALEAGDIAFYRQCSWHTGNYVPYIKRATLHDRFYSADDVAWIEKMAEMQSSWEPTARRIRERLSP